MLRTEDLRTDTRLLLITVDPFTPATPQSISRWLRSVMKNAGIDEKVFKAHWTRSAASSKARQYIALDKVMQAAGWKTSVTFLKHYNKPVIKRGEFARRYGVMFDTALWFSVSSMAHTSCCWYTTDYRLNDAFWCTFGDVSQTPC